MFPAHVDYIMTYYPFILLKCIFCLCKSYTVPYLILFLSHTYNSHSVCTTYLIRFKYLFYYYYYFYFCYFKCALLVSSPAAIALAIQMYSFCHINKAHLNWKLNWEHASDWLTAVGRFWHLCHLCCWHTNRFDLSRQLFKSVFTWVETLYACFPQKQKISHIGGVQMWALPQIFFFKFSRGSDHKNKQARPSTNE